MTETTTATRIILCGDDGSPHADRAWLWINNQVWPGFEAHVISSVRLIDDVASHDNPRLSLMATAGRRHFSESQLTAVKSFSSSADPCAALGQAPGDLVVVGPRGRSGLTAMALGSTAEHLLSKGGRPLVIAATPDTVTKVVICTDGSSTAADAAAFAATLPLMDAASEIVVLGVITGDAQQQSTRVQSGVAEVVEQLDRTGARPLIVHGETTTAATILGMCAELGANLVVAGTRGSSPMRRALVGSTTWSIARSGEITLLAVPPAASEEGAAPAGSE
jgi:nucleotide-binding universal stress UspA family protein